MRKKYSKETYLAWFDLEMTGLNPETCHIIEIASVITNSAFDIIAESPNVIIHQPINILENMNPWCLNVHGASGLIENSYNSKISVREAENIMLEFVSRYIQPLSSPLCGNSVWQDRRFMCRYMPKLESYFTHQLLDLATLRILDCISNSDKSLREDEYIPQGKHQALNDIKDHVTEFKFLKRKLNLS